MLQERRDRAKGLFTGGPHSEDELARALRRFVRKASSYLLCTAGLETLREDGQCVRQPSTSLLTGMIGHCCGISVPPVPHYSINYTREASHPRIIPIPAKTSQIFPTCITKVFPSQDVLVSTQQKRMRHKNLQVDGGYSH